MGVGEREGVKWKAILCEVTYIFLKVVSTGTNPTFKAKLVPYEYVPTMGYCRNNLLWSSFGFKSSISTNGDYFKDSWCNDIFVYMWILFYSCGSIRGQFSAILNSGVWISSWGIRKISLTFWNASSSYFNHYLFCQKHYSYLFAFSQK